MCISIFDWVETQYAIFFWKIPSLCQFISGRHMNGDSRVTTYAKGPDFPLFLPPMPHSRFVLLPPCSGLCCLRVNYRQPCEHFSCILHYNFLPAHLHSLTWPAHFRDWFLRSSACGNPQTEHIRPAIFLFRECKKLVDFFWLSYD